MSMFVEMEIGYMEGVDDWTGALKENCFVNDTMYCIREALGTINMDDVGLTLQKTSYSTVCAERDKLAARVKELEKQLEK